MKAEKINENCQADPMMATIVAHTTALHAAGRETPVFFVPPLEFWGMVERHGVKLEGNFSEPLEIEVDAPVGRVRVQIDPNLTGNEVRWGAAVRYEAQSRIRPVTASSEHPATAQDLKSDTEQMLLKAARHHARNHDERAVEFVKAYLDLSGR